jgi:LAO/AO transport system kinase
MGVPEEEAEPDQGGSGQPRWEIPVLQTVAQTGEGVRELLDAVADHRSFLELSGGLAARRKARAAGRVREVVERELRRVSWAHAGVQEILEKGVVEIGAGRETPYSLAADIIAELMGPGTK